MEIPDDLARELWTIVKDKRDMAAIAATSERELNELLHRMKDAGMAGHLPSVEDVITAWKAEGEPLS